MAVTRIRVGAEHPNVADVLDYAIALIEEHGWNNKIKEGVASSDTGGYTLHDSIGQACERLSHAVAGSRQKDWTVSVEGISRNLRVEATTLVQNAIAEHAPAGASLDDRVFNDNAKNADEVLTVLRTAREAAE